MKGIVKWFSAPKGYGFIYADGKDVFVHKEDVLSEDGTGILLNGQHVEFTLAPGIKADKATNVKIIPALAEDKKTKQFDDE